MTRAYEPVAIARQFRYVREAGANHGARVEAIQHWALGTFGDSWCDEFGVGFILDICYQGASPFPRTTDINASTISALAYAKSKGWVTTTPAVNDLVFSVHPDGAPHHVAIVSAVSPLASIAGNTSSDGVSSNGDGVYEHAISAADKVFVHLPN